jgi:hypothetical protein
VNKVSAEENRKREREREREKETSHNAMVGGFGCVYLPAGVLVLWPVDDSMDIN